MLGAAKLGLLVPYTLTHVHILLCDPQMGYTHAWGEVAAHNPQQFTHLNDACADTDASIGHAATM